MNKIKFLARSIVLLSAINSIDVSGEYYIVQPGDVLSTIAKKKIVKGDLPINIEQVMLTIYKLNPDVFIDGDVNRIWPERKIYIPDNVADFVQLSKNEATQRLRDRNYLRGLYSQASSLKLSGSSGSANVSGHNAQDYSRILQTLDNHQQHIELLRLENAHLSKSFKLLERALGRIVIVQGLLTNDVVKVKSKLFNVSPEVVATAVPENSAVGKEAVASGNTALVALPNEASLAKSEAVAIQSDSIAPQAFPATAPEVVSGENSEPVARVDANLPSTVDKVESSLSPGGAGKSGHTEPDTDYWLDIAMIAAILLPVILLLLWFLDFRRIRTKLSSAKPTADLGVAPKVSIKDRLITGSDNSRYSVTAGASDNFDDDFGPVRIKADKPGKDNELVGCITELGGVLELLDMCLLCGDYKQAHTVTLQALVDHQSSPVLAKKLAFIERKLGKH